MEDDILLQDPIGWAIETKKHLDKVKIYLSTEQLTKILDTYIKETFETYRTIINKAANQPQPYQKEFGFTPMEVDEENDEEETE